MDCKGTGQLAPVFGATLRDGHYWGGEVRCEECGTMSALAGRVSTIEPVPTHAPPPCDVCLAWDMPHPQGCQRTTPTTLRKDGPESDDEYLDRLLGVGYRDRPTENAWYLVESEDACNDDMFRKQPVGPLCRVCARERGLIE